MSASLVGSEMCIRDRLKLVEAGHSWSKLVEAGRSASKRVLAGRSWSKPVSYTHLTLPTICSV
eukprot:574760-Alexandrium_andersonii.AAC.1